MEPMQVPTITSFVIRFVQEQPEQTGDPASYRGTIHHVQTSQEISFTRWQEAVEFIQRFISIEK